MVRVTIRILALLLALVAPGRVARAAPVPTSASSMTATSQTASSTSSVPTVMPTQSMKLPPQARAYAASLGIYPDAFAALAMSASAAVELDRREPHHHHDDHHREKIVVNGDHDRVEARDPHHHHDDHHREKIIVNGDHDRVEAREPHHHHDHHKEKIVVNGDHDRVEARDPHHHHDHHREKVIVNGDHDHVDARRSNDESKGVPGIIQLFRNDSADVASLVVDQSDPSTPMFMASPMNATQVRLVFLSEEDAQSAGLNMSSLNATEVPVQLTVDAFNPISAMSGAVDDVLATLCATVGGVLDGLLGAIGLKLCPESAASMSTAQAFAYDTESGVVRPIGGGDVAMQLHSAAAPAAANVSEAAVDFPDTASRPPIMAAEATNVTAASSSNATAASAAGVPVTLVFHPLEMQVKIVNSSAITGGNSTQQAASAEEPKSSLA